MKVEVDTDIGGATLLLEALAKLNLHDARRNSTVAAELLRRCLQRPKEGWLYTSDPQGEDIWSSFAPLLARTNPADPVRADCEDQTAAHAAAFAILQPDWTIEVAITQPRPGAMAHAYCIIDGSVFDPSAFNGMKAPPDSFYLSGETARIRIQ